MIGNVSVLICKRFYTRRAINGKITSFGGTPLWHPHSRGTPSHRGTKFCTKN